MFASSVGCVTEEGMTCIARYGFEDEGVESCGFGPNVRRVFERVVRYDIGVLALR